MNNAICYMQWKKSFLDLDFGAAILSNLRIWQWAIIQKWTLLFICNSHHHYYYLLFKFDLANYY